MVTKAHVCSSNMRSSYPLVTSLLLTSVRIPTFSLLYAEEEAEPSVWSCRLQYKRYPEQNLSCIPFSLLLLLFTYWPTGFWQHSSPRQLFRGFWNLSFPTRLDGQAMANLYLISRLYSLTIPLFRLEWIHICMLSSVSTSLSISYWCWGRLPGYSTWVNLRLQMTKRLHTWHRSRHSSKKSWTLSCRYQQVTHMGISMRNISTSHLLTWSAFNFSPHRFTDQGQQPKCIPVFPASWVIPAETFSDSPKKLLSTLMQLINTLPVSFIFANALYVFPGDGKMSVTDAWRRSIWARRILWAILVSLCSFVYYIWSLAFLSMSLWSHQCVLLIMNVS